MFETTKRNCIDYQEMVANQASIARNCVELERLEDAKRYQSNAASTYRYMWERLGRLIA